MGVQTGDTRGHRLRLPQRAEAELAELGRGLLRAIGCTSRWQDQMPSGPRCDLVTYDHGKSHSAFVRKNLVVISSPSGSTLASMFFIESLVPSVCG